MNLNPSNSNSNLQAKLCKASDLNTNVIGEKFSPTTSYTKKGVSRLKDNSNSNLTYTTNTPESHSKQSIKVNNEDVIVEPIYEKPSTRKPMNRTEDHGDLIVNTLEFFRERTAVDDEKIPNAFSSIQSRLQKAKEENRRILLLTYEGYDGHRIVIQLSYIGETWAKGDCVKYRNGDKVVIPYTFHYSDVYVNNQKVLVIAEGENPYYGT